LRCYSRHVSPRTARRAVRLNAVALQPGLGSKAAHPVATDVSDTFIAHYVGVAEMDGGFAFRENGAAIVPNGPSDKLVLSPNGAFEPAVGSVFNNFGGLGRDDRIRCDTPVWESPAAKLYRHPVGRSSRRCSSSRNRPNPT